MPPGISREMAQRIANVTYYKYVFLITVLWLSANFALLIYINEIILCAVWISERKYYSRPLPQLCHKRYNGNHVKSHLYIAHSRLDTQDPLLTHWGRATHICVSNLIIGSDNGLSPGRRHAIIWTNAGILLIRPWGTKSRAKFTRNSHIFIHENALENVVWKMAAILSRPQCVNMDNL